VGIHIRLCPSHEEGASLISAVLNATDSHPVAASPPPRDA
jgi:hypothetical protein